MGPSAAAPWVPLQMHHMLKTVFHAGQSVQHCHCQLMRMKGKHVNLVSSCMTRIQIHTPCECTCMRPHGLIFPLPQGLQRPRHHESSCIGKYDSKYCRLHALMIPQEAGCNNDFLKKAVQEVNVDPPSERRQKSPIRVPTSRRIRLVWVTACRLPQQWAHQPVCSVLGSFA